MKLLELVPSLLPNDEQNEPIIKHECNQVPEKDEVENLVKGNNLLSRLYRWFIRKGTLSSSNYYAQTCLKSTSAINSEIRKHLQNFPHMVHPFSPLKNFWNIVMIFFTLKLLILIPFFKAFSFDEQWQVLPYGLTIDLISLFDIIVHFRTGYFDQRTKTVNLDPKIVFTEYLKDGFICDALAAIPIETFHFIIHNGQIHWLWSNVNFVKIVKLRNLIYYIDELRKSYHISFLKVKILQVAIIILIGMHWSACVVYYVPLFLLKYYRIDPSESKSWIFSETVTRRDKKWKIYILSMNRAIISLVSSAHYLQVLATEDMIVNFILAVIGKIGFVYLLAQFYKLLTAFNATDKDHLKLLHQLKEYMHYKELPRVTQKRLMVYCYYWYKKNFSRDQNLLTQVSEPIREEIALDKFAKFLEVVYLFKDLPKDVKLKLVSTVKVEIYLSSDFIIKSGTHGDSLFYIASGTVAVYTNLGKEVCHLEDGAYFGEIALVMENELRVANVVAIETCEIWRIPREAFHRVIAPYTSLLSRLQKVVLEELEKSQNLDEMFKLDNSQPHYINVSNIRGKRRN